MTPRERILKAINHQEPDRVPLAGSFRPEVIKRLQEHFGARNVSEIYDRLGIDWRGGIGMRPHPDFVERCKASGGTGKIMRDDGSYEDEWGVVQCTPSKNSPYERFVYHPLADEKNLTTYRFPDFTHPARWVGLAEAAAKQKSTYVVSAGVSTLFKAGWHLRGLTQWLEDIAGNQDFVNELLDHLTEIERNIVKGYCEAGAEIISMGGDIAMQEGPFMSPATWRKLFKWRDAIILDEAKRHGIKHFYFHTDGNLTPLMDDLIEIGFDIFDPIQPECMDPYKTKARWGDRITLHGTISSQHTLPHGSVDDVKREVEERIRRCGVGGGLVIAPNNVVQYDVPIENVLALYETARAITYPL